MTISPAPSAVDTTTYVSILQFYARQQHLIDDGLAIEWAATFTEDGVFVNNVKPEPTYGREGIAAAAGHISSGLREAGIQRRHVLDVVDVRHACHGELYARSYVQVIETPRDGAPVLRASTSCEDYLVHDAVEGWLVRSRKVSRDDIASADSANAAA